MEKVDTFVQEGMRYVSMVSSVAESNPRRQPVIKMALLERQDRERDLK